MVDWSLFSLTTSFMRADCIAASPFFTNRASSEEVVPPTLWRAFRNYTLCTRRALNRHIMNFSDPSLQQCLDYFTEELHASSWGGRDEAAMQHYAARQRGVVNVDTLPWPPRPEYVAWLRSRNRLGT